MTKCIALEGGSGYFDAAGRLGICCNDIIKGNREDYQILNYADRKNYFNDKAFTLESFDFCNLCKQNENQGYKSIRQFLNEKSEIFDLNINVGNVCNLRCAMCRPEFSFLLSNDISKLPEEFSEFYKFKKLKSYHLTVDIRNQIENFIESVDKKLEIKVLGGEPLANDDIVDWFIHLLNKFDSKIHRFRITSNLTYNTKKTMKLTEQDKVRITASIEGFEDSYEWGRFGVKWKTVSDNLLYFKKHIGDNLQVHSVINAISILGDKSLSNFLKENNIRNSKLSLIHPAFLQLCVLNQKERDILSLKNVESYDQNLRNLFVKYMLNLEKSRKQEMPQSISTFFDINRDN